MRVNDIEETLPNGFHDSILEHVEIDYVNKRAIFKIQVDVTDHIKSYTREAKACRFYVSYSIIVFPGKNAAFSWIEDSVQ